MNKKIIDAKQFNVILEQIGREFVEAHHADLKKKDVVIVGIYNRGVPLAKRLAAILQKKYRYTVTLGFLDITLYRDDVGEIANQPLVKETDISCSIEGKTILLVDDVLYTGRTIRAALDALLELGRPRVVRLTAVVDRSGRELPIHPDYYGTKMNVEKNERVQLKIQELDKEDSVWVMRRSDKNLKKLSN